ncbi:unnamed protein product [Leptosia nina]|uniref:Uncharacterized protein n=1 Tax=Leptosia nina TaxID=320188 RepID=A0AAV1IZP4_9NEOP
MSRTLRVTERGRRLNAAHEAIETALGARAGRTRVRSTQTVEIVVVVSLGETKHIRAQTIHPQRYYAECFD